MMELVLKGLRRWCDVESVLIDCDGYNDEDIEWKKVVVRWSTS